MDWVIRILGRVPLAKRMVGLMFQRHLHQRASIQIVADELSYNASQMDNDRSPVNKFQYVQFDAWKAHRRDIYLRLRANTELLADVSNTYEALSRMEYGAHGPSGDHVRDVAERLRATLN